MRLDYYLSRTEVTIKTDRKPLRYVLEEKWMNKKIQWWVLKLKGYDFKMEYLAWNDNTCTDLLFRILKQSEFESVVSTGLGDRDYPMHMINSHRLRNRRVLNDCGEKNAEIISNSHENDVIKKKQKESEIATDETMYGLQIRKEVLYYFSGIDEKVRLKLVVAN